MFLFGIHSECGRPGQLGADFRNSRDGGCEIGIGFLLLLPGLCVGGMDGMAGASAHRDIDSPFLAYGGKDRIWFQVSGPCGAFWILPGFRNDYTSSVCSRQY